MDGKANCSGTIETRAGQKRVGACAAVAAARETGLGGRNMDGWGPGDDKAVRMCIFREVAGGGYHARSSLGTCC